MCRHLNWQRCNCRRWPLAACVFSSRSLWPEPRSAASGRKAFLIWSCEVGHQRPDRKNTTAKIADCLPPSEGIPGELGEWFKPAVLKTADGQPSVSSNLTLSAGTACCVVQSRSIEPPLQRDSGLGCSAPWWRADRGLAFDHAALVERAVRIIRSGLQASAALPKKSGLNALRRRSRPARTWSSAGWPNALNVLVHNTLRFAPGTWQRFVRFPAG